jgi:dsRNA-specific ribonuclease
LQMLLTTPFRIPQVDSFDLYWDEGTTFTMHVDPPRPGSPSAAENIQTMRLITHTLRQSTLSDYSIDSRLDFIALFSPCEENQLAGWWAENRQRDPAAVRYQARDKPVGFLRAPSQHNNAPLIFGSWRVSGLDTENTVEVECIPLPRRRHFLARNTLAKSAQPEPDDASSGKHLRLPIQDCTVDRLPFQYARFNLFIPALLGHVEVLMVTDRLRTTILENVPMKDARHISTAIIAPSAGWMTNYQRYEFFGDTVLKFVVSYQLFCDHENWHEGYLSEKKHRIVSNPRLAKAALLKGLDQYIITESLVGRKKWPPRFISDIKSGSATKRSLSTKVMADVVESLIGAAFIDSGMDSARRCIHAFLPEVRASTPMLPHYPNLEQFNTTAILNAESIVGHRFGNKTLLLEALTHPSCGHGVQTESYQRLEFLGDAVLDQLIVSLITAHPRAAELTQGQMSLIRAALVNSYFLGHLCLDFSIKEETVVVKQRPHGRFATEKDTDYAHLWCLLRHTDADITNAQHACVERSATLRAEINRSLSQGKSHPWLHLTRLNPDKFFSDMIESLVGAIFVDSAGSLDECTRFIARIGLTSYLNRVLAGHVDVDHPKSALHQKAGSQSVAYDVRQEGTPDDPTYGCTVTASGVEIASVKGCLCKEEAIVAGALAAMKLEGRLKRSS